MARLAAVYNPVKPMQSLHLELPDPLYAEAQRAAADGGYPDMASYVADLIVQDMEPALTPEQLALVDQADAEVNAGNFLTIEQAEARSAAFKAEWRRTNPS